MGWTLAARFTQALGHALRRHPDAQHIILLGDLANTGDAAEYARLAPLLADCPIPVTVTEWATMTSAHRLRNTFFDAADAGGFLQSALDLGACAPPDP